MSRIEIATADSADEVLPLLCEFPGARLRPEDWRRILFDLPWEVDDPLRGFVMRDDRGQVVGFIGVIPSLRTIAGRARRVGHVSSWIVRDEHRSSSLELVLPLLALRDRTLVNVSPSESAFEIFRSLGFQTLESSQRLIPPLTPPLSLACLWKIHACFDDAAIRSRVPAIEQRLLADMSGTLAKPVLLEGEQRLLLLIATRSPWKPGKPLAHVDYASDWDLLGRWLPAASAAYGKALGAWGLRLDSRHDRAGRTWLSVERRLPRPWLFRPEDPSVRPEHLDGLYSESVSHPG